MIFDWLKRLFRIKTPPKTPKAGEWRFVTKDILDGRKKDVIEKKKRISLSSTDWYRLELPKEEERMPIKVYHAYKFGEILKLKSLKAARLEKEAHELKMLEEEVRAMLTGINRYIEGRKAKEAKTMLDRVLGKMVKVKDSSICQRHLQLQSQYLNLVAELEREKLARLEEEKRRKEEEERKKREAEEKARKARERKEREKYERGVAEAKKFADEARKKEEAEQAERKRLESLSSELKDDWQDFKKVLDDNGVRYLYHFTDTRNIPSIKRHGGLLSWYYCKKHDITIPCQGGDYDSRELDKKYGLEDYVRLSFCDDHPMAYRLKQSGSNIVSLRIKVEVALLKDTQFSDMNAADKRHTHGKRLEHLQMVDFDATRMHYLRSDDPNFKPHQAEVMVKTFLPLKYIENI